MNDSTQPTGRLRLRFRLSTLALLLVTVSIGMAFVTYHHMYGTDQLYIDVTSADGTVGYDATVTLTSTGNPTSFQKAQTLLCRFLGNERRLPISLHFQIYDDGRLTEGVATRLRYNRSTDKVTMIQFRNFEIEEAAPLFFRDWGKLQYLEFRDTKVPKAWRHELKNISASHVVISGSRCNIQAG